MKNLNAKQNWKKQNRATRLAIWDLSGAECGILAEGQKALASVCAELVGQDTADQVLDRQRDFAGRISNIENSPETYGQSIGEQQKHYGQTFRMVASGKDCDCEIEDADRALIAIATHNQEGSGRSVVELE